MTTEQHYCDFCGEKIHGGDSSFGRVFFRGIFKKLYVEFRYEGDCGGMDLPSVCKSCESSIMKFFAEWCGISDKS